MDKTATSWQIFRAGREQKEELLDLCRDTYGKADIAQSDFFDWQYCRNPAGPALIWCARNNGIIAGQYVVLPTRMSFGNEIITGSLSLNTITRSEYRGQGIFSRLAEETYLDCRQQNIAFTYGFPNTNSYHGFVKKLGFSDLGDLPLLVYPLNLPRLAAIRQSSLITRMAGKAAQSLYRFYAQRKLTHNEPGIELRPVSKFGPEFNNFWRLAVNRRYIMTVKDQQYLNWRYTGVPRRNYTILAAYHHDSLVGFIVLAAMSKEGIKFGGIVDFLCAPGSIGERAGRLLAGSSIKYFYSTHCDLILCMLQDRVKEFDILIETGFIYCPVRLRKRLFPLIYRCHNSKYDRAFLNCKEWFLTFGDFDVF